MTLAEVVGLLFGSYFTALGLGYLLSRLFTSFDEISKG